MESFPDMTINGTKVFRATGIGDPGRVSGAGTRRPDPEVPERARRRTFTAKCKLEVLAAYDAAPDGEKGAVLRREGLYSSHIVDWRRGRRAGRSRDASRAPPSNPSWSPHPRVRWPGSLRVKTVVGAPRICEMTWSVSGPDGRATFEWVEIDSTSGIRWRRIGKHEVFREP